MRRLIINADDFGYTHGVNRAIVEAHTRGVVTSSTLMANGVAFDEATHLAKNLPALSIGCHIVLIDGQPVLEAGQIPSLTQQVSNGPYFREGMASFVVRALAGQINPEEIESETAAQIRKIQSSGIPVSHVDSHKHTHVFPSVLRPLLRAARSRGVTAVRNPFGPRRPLKSSDLLSRPGVWTRYAEVRVLRTLARKFQKTVERMQMKSTDGTFGIEVTGLLDHRLFRAIAEIVPEGTWEFVCHPGHNDADLQRAATRLRESRELELAVLTLPEARTILAEREISLISYRDI